MPRIVEQYKLHHSSKVHRGKVVVTEEREDRSFWVYTQDDVDNLLRQTREETLKLCILLLNDCVPAKKVSKRIQNFIDTGKLD